MLSRKGLKWWFANLGGYPAIATAEIGTTSRTCLYDGQEAALDMTKKYAVLRLKVPQPEDGFLEAFGLGLMDLNCWGDEYFDASGYPYPDEVHAFVHDWLNLSGDFGAAIRKVGPGTREATGATDNGERSRQGHPIVHATSGK